MTAGKRPRLMMRRTVSVASLGAGAAAAAAAGGCGGEVAAAVAAGSDHPLSADHQFQRPQHPHVVVPHQVIGFAAPTEDPSPSAATTLPPSPAGTKSRPFSGLSILADPSNKELGPCSPHGKVGLGIVAALDKDELSGSSSPTSVIRSSLAQAGVVAPAKNFHYHQSARYNMHDTHQRKHKDAADSATFHLCLEANSTKCALRPSFTTLGFLDSCYQCKRDISHGRDIFMYKGDRAFCSAECRHQQILNDERLERREKCTSAALKQMGSVPQQVRHNQRAKVTPATTAAAA
ncbi:hypothetical protein SELMODRAFT_448491 [Selaginella moellendorffii]|uniref:FLZ-type domain-containing protein n=1 Tax=Selaginella moellendorffii TaxID=88036 RepID=D8T7Q0_SELML|nr:uncharacterized protein LOC9631914 [Selaginella moellendorffii]EFJ07378.1 hypothetical protein SELMODRAFT_448491 [Selaginella moellendorffii]|eukprot:XP_002991624.1 uncharacterized protein LOC9631914 [Selaginella moellendorffii]